MTQQEPQQATQQATRQATRQAGEGAGSTSELVTGFGGAVTVPDPASDREPVRPLRRPRVVDLWWGCRLGHPDPQMCPECTPPMEDRCPVAGWDGRVCRVLGEHDVHTDGAGTSWHQLSAAEVAAMVELDAEGAAEVAAEVTAQSARGDATS